MENEKHRLNQFEPKKVVVPNDDFFVSLAKSAIETGKQQQSKSKLKIIYFSISTVAAILIAGFFFFNQGAQETIKSDSIPALAKVKTNELEEYLKEEKQTQVLADDDNYIPVVSVGMSDNKNLFASISTGDLVQYMEEEDVDISQDEVDDLFY